MTDTNHPQISKNEDVLSLQKHRIDVAKFNVGIQSITGNTESDATVLLNALEKAEGDAFLMCEALKKCSTARSVWHARLFAKKALMNIRSYKND